MDSRPSRSRRIRRSPPPPPPPPGEEDQARSIGGDDSRISALGDDTLVEILARLRCTRAAARTSLLSRRWRDLWTRLPDLTFRGLTAAKVEAALARIPRPAAVSLLDIRLDSSRDWDSSKMDDAGAKSLLLRAAKRISPEELVFFLPQDGFLVKPGRPVQLAVPCLRRATSIELDALLLRLKPPPADLPALERLSLAGKIFGVGAFLDRCPRLRELRVTFRALSLAAAEAELAAIEARRGRGLAVSLLGFDGDCIAPERRRWDDDDHHGLSPILRAAARLSPQELVFRHSCGHTRLDLPCFPEATSIKLSLYTAHLSMPPGGEFSALERLTLWYSSFASLQTLVSLCPRLRVLTVGSSGADGRICRVRSASLEELVVRAAHGDAIGYRPQTGRQYIDIVTPVLKRLEMTFWANMKLRVSVSAPMLDKVSWRRFYSCSALVFGSWSLSQTNLETAESSHGEDDSECSLLLHVLRLHMSAQCHPGEELNFAKEMEKLPFTDFSALELHLTTRGHVFRAFVSRLLEMDQFKTTTRLKVVLVTEYQVTRAACPENCCHSDEPQNLGSQSILLTHLEEVEIDRFKGGDRELDFLTHMLGCTPMLKRMTVKLSPQHLISHRCCTTKICNILLAYPSVTFYVYRNSGELVPHTCIQSA